MAILVADARVTAEQVMEIISTSLTEDQVNAFINMANTVVDERLIDQNLGSDLLMQIELLLSAHFVSLRDPRAQQEKVDEYSVTYQGSTGEGLKASIYGQQAIALDTSGTLANLAKPRAMLKLS
jgi:hypothetical protein